MVQLYRLFVSFFSVRAVSRFLRMLPLFLPVGMFLAACNFAGPTQPTAIPGGATVPPSTVNGTPAPDTTTTLPVVLDVTTAGQPVQITGSFTYTNDFIFTYYVEHAVALVDMYGFVRRDHEWELPVESQVLGFLEVDEEARRGDYKLLLPALPNGTLVDVDNDGQTDSGVQIFAVTYWPNEADGPFSEGDDRSLGWPSYLASTVNNPEDDDEVVGGKLVVWAPNGEQRFPTGFGPDGLLFTSDDPVTSLRAGYTVVNIDENPFTFSQASQQELTLYEPKDVAIKDFSALSYSQAFAQMFEQVRREYAFSGITGKEPDWNTLYDQITLQVAEAERNKNAQSFYLALRSFITAFKDGHVNLNGGKFDADFFQQQFSGGYGLAIRELDDKRVLVTYILDEGPADWVGIEIGAEIVAFNNRPIGEAISAVQPFGGPFSTDFGLRYEQERYLFRAPVAMTATITFTNPGRKATTVTLNAVSELQSLLVTSLLQDADPVALPVEFRLLDSGIGYIKINSYYDDLNLLNRLFVRALETFKRLEAQGLIIDLRQNGGGAPISLANYLSDQEIPLGQTEYFSEKTNRFEPDGSPRKVEPAKNRYQFAKMALLVGPACASACDIGAYGFSRLPGMLVVGHSPTAGVYAEVARGQFHLPEGIDLQVPTGRIVLSDGSILLEGEGVKPTLRVPFTQETVLSPDDTVLREAEKALLEG